MNIYVGNLTFAITEDELRQAFEAFGKVDTATIIKDKYIYLHTFLKTADDL